MDNFQSNPDVDFVDESVWRVVVGEHNHGETAELRGVSKPYQCVFPLEARIRVTRWIVSPADWHRSLHFPVPIFLSCRPGKNSTGKWGQEGLEKRRKLVCQPFILQVQESYTVTIRFLAAISQVPMIWPFSTIVAE